MDQGKRPGPDPQQDQSPRSVARIPLLRAEDGVQQVKARNHRAPSAQQRPLGNHHVADHVGPAQVVGIRLVGRRLVETGQDVFDPFPHRAEPAGSRLADPGEQRGTLPGVPGSARQVKVVQESQPAVEEEQQGRQDHGFSTGGHLPSQHQHAHEAQGHHQGSGNRHGRLQAAAQQIEGGAQGIRQEGIAQAGSREERIIRREAFPGQSRNKAQVHRQVAVSALAHMPVSGPVHPHHMGVLQVRAQDRQGNQHRQCFPQHGLFLRVPGGGIPPVPQEPAGQRQEQQQPCRRRVGRRREAEEERKQRRKPHFFQHAEAEPQPDPVQRLMPRQQETNRKNAEGQIEQQI